MLSQFLRPRHQILPEGEVLVTIAPGMCRRFNPTQLSAFAWGILSDLDPEEHERLNPTLKRGKKPRLSPAASRLMQTLVRCAGKTVGWPVIESLFPNAKKAIGNVYLSEIRNELTRLGYPEAITTYRGEGVMLSKDAAKEFGVREIER